jgi:hypothetical protein
MYDSFKILQFWQPFVVGHSGSAVARGPPRAWRSAAVAYGGRFAAPYMPKISPDKS